jgi:hypothetical protein
MANFQLQNDLIYTFTIHVENAAGALEPAPVGDTFTVVSSAPASLNAVIGADAAGNPAVVANALVVAGTGYTITTSDSAGLKVAVDTMDIVADTTPTQIALDTVDATTTSQAVPTNPGP